MFKFEKFTPEEFRSYAERYGSIVVWLSDVFPNSRENLEARLNFALKRKKAVVAHALDWIGILGTGKFKHIIYANTLKEFEVKIIKAYLNIAVITKRDENRIEPLKITPDEIEQINSEYFKNNIDEFFESVPYNEINDLLALQSDVNPLYGENSELFEFLKQTRQVTK